MSRAAIHIRNLAIAGLLCAYNSCCSQLPDYHVRLFDENFGLRNDLSKVTRDHLGFVWITYPDRIQRFDGKKVKEFYLSGRTHAIFCDKESRIWLGMDKQIFHYVNEYKGFSKILIDGKINFAIGYFFSLPGNDVCVSTSNGLYAWNLAGQYFKQIHFKEIEAKLPLKEPFANIYENRFFFLSGDSVFDFDMQTHSLLSLPAKNIEKMYPVAPGLLLVTTNAASSFWYDFIAHLITPIELSTKKDRKENNFLYVTAAQPIDEDHFLLTSHSGVFELTPRRRSFKLLLLFHRGKPLETTPLYNDLYIDHTNTVWLTFSTGLLSFRTGQETIGLIRNKESDPEKAWPNNVRNFAEDERHNLWIATSHGFGYWDLQRNTISMIPLKEGSSDQPGQPSIRGLAYDGHYLIIGSPLGGIWLYNPSTKKYKRPLFESGNKGDSLRKRLEKDFLVQVKALSNGNYIIAGRKGYELDGKSYGVKDLVLPGDNTRLNFTYQDSQHRVWIGTMTTLHCFDSNMTYLRKITLDKSFRSMEQISPHEFLVGTSEGIYRMNDSKGKLECRYGPGFSMSTRVDLIVTDKQGICWIATNQGLYRYDVGSGSMHVYNHSDNVQGFAFEDNCFFYDKENDLLYLGGKNGINYFHPSRLHPPGDSLIVSLTHVKINDDDTSFYLNSSPFDLSYHKRSLEFEFVAPWFNSADQVVYRYKLNGYDRDWKYVDNSNSVRLTSLPSGKYSFLLQSSLDGKKWFDSADQFSFEIHPPFWKTAWFISLLIALAILCLYSWITTMRQRIRSEKLLNYFATSLYGQNTVEDVFMTIARNCVTLLDSQSCAIYQYDEQKEVLIQKAACQSGNLACDSMLAPVEIPVDKEGAKKGSKHDWYDKDGRSLSKVAVPIIADGKVFGVIESGYSKKYFYRTRYRQLMEKVASIGAAKISRYLVEEKLRTKIARDLHDEMGSTLTSINIISKMAIEQGNDLVTQKNYLAHIREYSGRMMESMSDIVWAINPANDTLDKMILRMKEFSAEILEPARINYFFSADINIETIKLNPEQRKDLYLVFKEALANAAKYSGATELHIDLKKQNDVLKLLITDNGKGFDANAEHKGNGLKNMRSRAMRMYAALDIRSSKEAGTSIHVQLPLT